MPVNLQLGLQVHCRPTSKIYTVLQVQDLSWRSTTSRSL